MLLGTFAFKTRMSHLFTITLQIYNKPADCARELFKPLKDGVSLLVCIKKVGKFWILGYFWAILAHVAWPRAQPLGQSISL